MGVYVRGLPGRGSARRRRERLRAPPAPRPGRGARSRLGAPLRARRVRVPRGLLRRARSLRGDTAIRGEGVLQVT